MGNLCLTGCRGPWWAGLGTDKVWMPNGLLSANPCLWRGQLCERDPGGTPCALVCGREGGAKARGVDDLDRSAIFTNPGNSSPPARIDLPSGAWRNGSTSDSRSEGWKFGSLCPHFAVLGVGIRLSKHTCGRPGRKQSLCTKSPALHEFVLLEEPTL